MFILVHSYTIGANRVIAENLVLLSCNNEFNRIVNV